MKKLINISTLYKSRTGNIFGTTWQQVATKMLPVLPAKTRALATNQQPETRANIELHKNVANVAAVATCKATSLNTLFTAQR